MLKTLVDAERSVHSFLEGNHGDNAFLLIPFILLSMAVVGWTLEKKAQ